MRTREERLEYNRQYRIRNAEKIRQYRIDNKEKIRTSRIQYDNNHAETIKEQQKKYGKQYRINNAEKIKQYNIDNKEKIMLYDCNSPVGRKKIHKKYRNNNKEKIVEYKLKKNYGITLVEYNSMIDNQEGKCAICGIHLDELTKKLVVDHDHKTNIVRGLLCDKCNRGLGHFNDDIQILKNAISYLKPKQVDIE